MQSEQEDRGQGCKKALIIGIDEYTSQSLPNLEFCKIDAEKLTELLTSPTFSYKISDSCKLIGKISYMKFRQSLYAFFHDAGPEDTLFLYFTGHGLISNHGDHLISTSETDPDAPEGYSFSIEEIIKLMINTKLTKILTVLDCCYGADPKISNKNDTAKIANEKVSSMSINADGIKYILSSSRAYQQSFGNDNGSIFTRYLLEGLQGGNGDAVDTNGNVTVAKLEYYITKKIMNMDQRLKQTPLITRIDTGKTDDDLILVRHAKFIKPKAEHRTSKDLEKISDIERLQSYYNVDATRIIRIREEHVKRLKTWIWSWERTSGKGKKPILLITGASGTGKSWLAYRLISDLMDNQTNVYAIKGTSVREDIIADTGPEKFEGNKIRERCVFVLDDRGVSIGGISTSLSPEDIYEIIKGLLPSGSEEQIFVGPIIISMRVANWDQIARGPNGKEEFVEDKLTEMIEKFSLPPLKNDDSEKLVESFYVSVDNSKPPYPNMVVSEEHKESIIRNSKGIPAVVRLFFDKQATKIKLEDLDLEEIVSNTKYYSLKQIFDYYLYKREDKEEVSSTLAFLYFVAKNGFISVGHLKRIREDSNYHLPNKIKSHIYYMDHERSLPLFNIDDYGIVLPFHDSVNDAIVSLVQNPEELELDVPSDDKAIRRAIRRIAEVDTTSNIKLKSEQEFIKLYRKSIIRSIDYYLDTKLIREKSRLGKISDESAYYFLSLFIEFLNQAKERTGFTSHWGGEYGLPYDFSIRGQWEEYREEPELFRKEFFRSDWQRLATKYVMDFKNIMGKTEIDYDGMKNRIDEQLLLIFQWLEWIEDPRIELKQHYLNFLSSSNSSIRNNIWMSVDKLIRNQIIEIVEIQSLSKHFFELLKSSDRHVRDRAWGSVLPHLIHNKILTEHDRKNFEKLLQVGEEDLRSYFWYYLPRYIKSGIITSDELRRHNAHFFELLRSTDENIRIESWRRAISQTVAYFNFDDYDDVQEDNSSLVQMEILTVGELRRHNAHFFELLRSTDENTRVDAWQISISDLVQMEILTVGELRRHNAHFFELLRSTYETMRFDAWKITHDLVDIKAVTEEEAKFFLGLLNDSEEGIRRDAWENIARLVKSQIIRPEMVRGVKEHIHDLLNSEIYHSWIGLISELLLARVINLLEAIDCYNQVIKHDRKIDTIRFALENAKGVCLYDFNELKEALKCYDRAIELMPTYAYAWNNKGLVLYDMKEYVEALKCYNRAIELMPTYAYAWNNKGLVLYDMKEYVEALKCYDRAIELMPTYVNALNSKANVLYKLEKYTEGLKCYERVLEIDGNSTYAWIGKGLCLEKLNKLNQAIESYSSAINIDPDNEEAHELRNKTEKSLY